LLGQRWEEHEVTVLLAQQQQQKQLEDNTTNNGGEEYFHSIQMIGNDNTSFLKTLQTLIVLFWRNGTEQIRDIPSLMSRLIPCIIFAFIIGGIYSNIGNDQVSIQNRKGVLYLLLVNSGFITIGPVAATFPLEKLVVARERTVQAYSTLAYFIAKVLVEIPLNLLPTLLYAVIAGLLIGLNPTTFGYYILIFMMYTLVIVALGLGIGAFAPSVDAASAMSAPFLVIGILFGGFYIQVDEIPIVLNWFPYISPLRWAFEALCINEFQEMTFSCDNTPADQCITTGEEALATISFDGHTTNYAVFGLGMLWIVYLVGTYLLLVMNEMHYLPLGHVGRTFIAKHSDAQETIIPVGGSGKDGLMNIPPSSKYVKIDHEEEEGIEEGVEEGIVTVNNKESDAKI